MLTVYHNPSCTKSRRALELLWDRGIAFEVVEYLQTPPSREVLVSLIERSADPAVAFVRREDPNFRDRGLTLADGAPVEAVVDLLCAHIDLLQRPIIVSGERVIIGRPPERVLDLLAGSGR